jgi:hypothetical protein
MAAAVPDNEHPVEKPERHRRYREQIHRGDFILVVV